MNDFWPVERFVELIQKEIPLIDVRAEIEFAQGHIPGSVNLPILNTAERTLVGTTYKQQGQDAAIELGHKLVCGSVKEQRVQSWLQAIAQNKNAVLTCFRGGLRSKIAQTWCREAGVNIPRIQGGTKALRTFLLSQLNECVDKIQLTVISGPTGAGKSILIRDLQNHRAVLDLEKIAHHRGSAFGGYLDQQPSQIFFENQIACELIKKQSESLIIEDESRMIGNCAVPESIYLKQRKSPLVFIEETLEVRIQNTFDEYILNTDLANGDSEKARVIFAHYQNCIQRISKKLGNARTNELLKDIKTSEEIHSQSGNLEANKIWIQKLLEWYYDPVYLKHLKVRGIKPSFQGTRKEAFDFLVKK